MHPQTPSPCFQYLANQHPSLLRPDGKTKRMSVYPTPFCSQHPSARTDRLVSNIKTSVTTSLFFSLSSFNFSLALSFPNLQNIVTELTHYTAHAPQNRWKCHFNFVSIRRKYGKWKEVCASGENAISRADSASLLQGPNRMKAELPAFVSRT